MVKYKLFSKKIGKKFVGVKHLLYLCIRNQNNSGFDNKTPRKGVVFETMKQFAVLTESGYHLNSDNGVLYLSKEEGNLFDEKTANRAVKMLIRKGVKAFKAEWLG